MQLPLLHLNCLAVHAGNVVGNKVVRNEVVCNEVVRNEVVRTTPVDATNNKITAEFAETEKN